MMGWWTRPCCDGDTAAAAPFAGKSVREDQLLGDFSLGGSKKDSASGRPYLGTVRPGLRLFWDVFTDIMMIIIPRARTSRGTGPVNLRGRWAEI
jgi:hypothetical protein